MLSRHVSVIDREAEDRKFLDGRTNDVLSGQVLSFRTGVYRISFHLLTQYCSSLKKLKTRRAGLRARRNDHYGSTLMLRR
jgi:hypothetical protein